ncbi:unnamed protein product [Rangifer tarandus platyrhynchus]|uniref:Uncharacterized protein n=2 Tax=Rangifer tarandus platyrhynchus TaxID=3082113 RepID=A0ABN8YFA2_RANTA|nr:unnamed protein product [Rangifer tarandus platyrhynchus]CAI9699427.1 unnamed protein product [Rangifer tarandus platyrhynchus]
MTKLLGPDRPEVEPYSMESRANSGQVLDLRASVYHVPIRNTPPPTKPGSAQSRLLQDFSPDHSDTHRGNAVCARETRRECRGRSIPAATRGSETTTGEGRKPVAWLRMAPAAAQEGPGGISEWHPASPGDLFGGPAVS